MSAEEPTDDGDEQGTDDDRADGGSGSSEDETHEVAGEGIDEGSPEGQDAPEDSETLDVEETARSARERLEAEADRAVAEFDQGVVDLLAWVLDTETRARIYVFLRQHPDSTSEEIADGTGLYPSTVREALAEMHGEKLVTRHKRASAGAGNNPYEYEAIAPSELVRGVVGQVQEQLNTVFNLDRRLGRGGEGEETDPVTITVEDDAE